MSVLNAPLNDPSRYAASKPVFRCDAALISLLSSLLPGAGPVQYPALSDSAWNDFHKLTVRHGLNGLLYREVRQGGAPIPADISASLRGCYLHRVAENMLVLKQLERIACAFTSRGVPLIALKGAAALLSLYDDVGCREISDIDLLVEEHALTEAKNIMEELGYLQQNPYSSIEDELLQFQNSHLPAYVRRDHFAIEIHGTILYGQGRREQSMREVWAQSTPLKCGNATLRCLAPSHFLLHGAVHLMKHIQSLSFGVKLKSFADMILLIRRFGPSINWNEFWATAAFWGITREVKLIVATLNYAWVLAIPSPAPSSCAVPTQILVYGPRTPAERRAASIIGGSTLRRLIKRLMSAKRPISVSQALYFLRLIFRRPDDLRQQYQLTAASWLAPYYLLRIFAIVRRALGELFEIIRASI